MADLWEAISDSHRRHLVQLLAEGEKTVTELAAHFPISRSAVSQHLLLLVEVGLVTARKQGRNRIYHLHGDGTARLQALFHTFLGQRNQADSLQAASRF
jgi:DNA-binding transcriptional ArsR family regulator